MPDTPPEPPPEPPPDTPPEPPPDQAAKRERVLARISRVKQDATERLQRDWTFYTWDEHTGEVRWMCAWDTTEDDVDAFAAAVAEAVGSPVP